MLTGKTILVYHDKAQNGTSTQFLGVWQVGYIEFDTRYLLLTNRFGEQEIITETMFERRCSYKVIPEFQRDLCYTNRSV